MSDIRVGCPRSGQPKTGKRRNHGHKIVSWGKGDLKYSQNRKNGIFDRKWLKNCIFMIFWPIFPGHFYQHDASRLRLPSNESLDDFYHVDIKIVLQATPSGSR